MEHRTAISGMRSRHANPDAARAPKQENSDEQYDETKPQQDSRASHTEAGMASAQAAAAGADRTHVDPVLWRGGNIVAAQMSARIRQATLADIDAVTPLLDAYRQFYGEPSDVALARSFMTERLQRQESIVLLALDDDNAVAGFTQLYPGFSSNRLARIYLLNDLFVVPAARRRGIAAALLTEAAATCRTRGAARLTLVTARTNIPAQKLYEACGWIRDETFCDYALSL